MTYTEKEKMLTKYVNYINKIYSNTVLSDEEIVNRCIGITDFMLYLGYIKYPQRESIIQLFNDLAVDIEIELNKILHMRKTIVENKVNNPRYKQWIICFVLKVLIDAKIRYYEVFINDIEEDKQIFINVNGIDYIIRTWSFYAINVDDENRTCEEIVDYTLYKLTQNDAETISSNKLNIKWNNAILKEDLINDSKIDKS